MQNTAGFGVCWSPAAEMQREALCSRSKQLLSFSLDTHKGLSSLCLCINTTFMLAALKYSASYLLVRVGGRCLTDLPALSGLHENCHHHCYQEMQCT